MKIYVHWLVSFVFFITPIIQTAEIAEFWKKIDDSVATFDPNRFGAALNNIGSLCILAKTKVLRDLINERNLRLCKCKYEISRQLLPYKSADLGLGAASAFMGGVISLIFGGAAIMYTATHDIDPCPDRCASYPTGLISLFCSACAFYQLHTLHVQEDARRAAEIQQLEHIVQRISNNTETMLAMLENHPIKTCCSELQL